MTAAAATRPIPARRTGYFALSRAHRYSILFALPLLIVYEALAALLARPGEGELRNGADALLRGAFTALAGPRGSAIFIGLVCVIGIFLVVRDLRKTRDGLKLGVFFGMLI